MIMEFNAVNGWFAMALFKMGARIKWASNDRSHLKSDDLDIIQAVAILSDGKIEPYMVKKNKKGEHPVVSYWTSLIRSLIWKEQDSSIKFADFIFDFDGSAQSVINLAIQLEKNQYRPVVKP